MLFVSILLYIMDTIYLDAAPRKQASQTKHKQLVVMTKFDLPPAFVEKQNYR